MASQDSASPVALEGLRVLDLSRVLAGPWSTQILGDLGAEVIKVENPTQRDTTRLWGPPFVESGEKPWDAAYYFCINRNKQAIAVDFSHPEGADILRRLAAQADVVIENFKVGTLARYGLDYETLKQDNPGLIYCSITGFGQTGPYSGRGGYDFLIQGMSGLMSITGTPDGEPGAGPMKVGIPASDLFSGLYATLSILAALNRRHIDGQGQYIDCALLDCQVAVLANQAMNYLYGGKVPTRLGNGHPNVVPYRDFAAADDYVLIACGNDTQFQALCQMLKREDLARDERFGANAGRQQHRKELELALAHTIATWPAAELLQAMDRFGVPGGPINALDQTLADPQVQARELLQEMHRDDGSLVSVLGFPIKLSRTPAQYRQAPPRFAQDTAACLQNELGLTEEELKQLAEAGVLGMG
jgi:crotonobetainyl-CoA:carnitine CoA-transferase CaiB-like acyl-CoA transferase